VTAIFDWLARTAEQVDRRVGWSKLPPVLAIPVLIGLRRRMRELNLYDTGRGPDDRPAADETDVGDYRVRRTLGGTFNDLDDPLMGSVGSRFGRNVPLEHTVPEPDDQLLSPNPRLISDRLLARREFQPATTLNLLAAAWIQFEVHDWFSHGDATDTWDVPLEPGDDWPQRPMEIKKTPPDPSPSPGPPTYVSDDTHWWDASQLYGGTREFNNVLRTGQDGKLHIDELGLPPADPDANLIGPAGNFWVGLAMLHSLFLREHNAICDRLASQYPSMDDQRLYDTARLITAAVIAKIHTIDWTPAIIAHPTTVFAMRANWFGLLGEQFERRFGRITKNDLLQGIPGSDTDHHHVPYSLTEEFVAVYRMHPLIPDDVVFRALADDGEVARWPMPELLIDHVRERLSETPMADLFYSFGRANPGALSLHNYPNGMRALERVDGPLDLAAADILRVRERGVPRYNEFRRLFRLPSVATFEELTGGDQALAEELRAIYQKVDRVDLMIGLYAEPKPRGFGFSDTAFRVFILMASRRLKSDRFLTRDFRAEVYTDVGMAWVRDADMRSVLLRHFPTLAPALAGVANPFAPWARTRPRLKGTPMATDDATYLTYTDDLEQRAPDEKVVIEKMVCTLHGNNIWAYNKYQHGIRDAHAKSHGILRGELTVYPDLPPELRQGLFATPATYPVIARLSSTAGAIRNDQLRGIHGLGVKLIGVEGERCLPDDVATTQDLLFVTHREFPFADAHAYQRRGMPLAWLLARLPDWGLGAAEDVLAAVDKVTGLVGVHLPEAVQLFIRPNYHILGQTFYTSAALRFGDHVAKMCVAPLSPSVTALENILLPHDSGPDAYRDQVVAFFATQTAEFEVRAQLCTNLTEMPIEDATVEWPESRSVYQGVAKLTFPVQNPATAERQAFGDDVLAFTPFRGLAAHRPLGSINRLKQRTYDASSEFRHLMNGVAQREPVSIDELPL
jgi:Animal haem peroxidase